MNLAVSDVTMLGEALRDYYGERSSTGIDGYSARALARVWKAERFSWWFTSITHRFPDMDGFSRRLQKAELDSITRSPASHRTLPYIYVGLPMEAA